MSYKSFFSVHIRDVCAINFKIVGASLFIKHRNAVVFCQILVQQDGKKCTKAESGRMCTGEGNVGAIICRKASKKINGVEKCILPSLLGGQELCFISTIVREVGVKPRTIKAGRFRKSGDNYWKLSLILTFVYMKLTLGQPLIVN